MRGCFLGALVLAFAAALYIRFGSGWIEVEDLPKWPSYLLYGAVSAFVWFLLENRLPLQDTLEKQAPLRRWAGRLLYLNLLTLAAVSVWAFFWREYSFSRYVVGLFWIFYSVEGLLIGWISGKLSLYHPRRVKVWVATRKISDEDIRRYFDPARGEIVVRRFEIQHAAPCQIVHQGEIVMALAKRFLIDTELSDRLGLSALQSPLHRSLHDAVNLVPTEPQQPGHGLLAGRLEPFNRQRFKQRREAAGGLRPG